MKKTIFFLSAVIVSITNAFAVVTWDGATKTAWTQGSGTSASPYIISSPNHLAYLAQQVSAGNTYAGKYFKQTEDFDLQSKAWTSIGTSSNKFGGIYDGGGRYVSNLKATSLFGQINNATIQNITIRGAEINYFTSLVYTTNGTCKLINCHNKCTLKHLRCGGLVFKSSGTKLELISCSNSGNIYSETEAGTSLFGGLICSSQCAILIDQCSSTGKFNLFFNNATSGGFIGEVSGSGNCTIQRSYSTSASTSGGTNCNHKHFISKVDGYFSGTITIKGCYAKGVSNICASNKINMTSCYVVVKAPCSSTFNNASYCFYCNETGSTTITNGTLMQSAAMKQSSFLPQINVGEQYFAMDVNNINEGYPILQWQQPNYTITWKNWDGTTLATTSVAQGVTPSYTGSTPTRPSTAEYAYTFSGWTPAITAATADKTYTATYTQTLRKYSITVNSSNVSQGTAAGGGTYDYGTNHQITATPNECYRFVQWSDSNTDNPRTITVTGAATYTAEFEQIQYTIEAQSADAGQGSATVTNP